MATLIPPTDASLEQFPESTWTSPGMRVIQGDHTFRRATALLDVVYAHKSGLDLHLQIIEPPASRDPANASERYPLVVFVQGSGWKPQSLGKDLPALARFAERGYVVAIVEHRPSAVAPFPAQVRDAKTAVRFLRANASQFFVDPERVAMWGTSSGGHTTVLACVTDGDPQFSDEPGDEPLGVRCYIDFYGHTDIARLNEEPSDRDHAAATSDEGVLLGGHAVLEHPELVAPTVAMNHIRADVPLRPLLIMHGSKDRVVPFAQSVLLHDALRAAGQPVELCQIAGADHNDAAFFQDDVFDIVDAFIRAA